MNVFKISTFLACLFLSQLGFAQDHAIDVEYQIFTMEDIDKNSGFNLEGSGYGIGYLGYVGLNSVAGEISIARLSVDRTQNDVLVETSDMYKIHLGGWNYVSGELRGFGIGGGTDIFFGDELFGFTGTLNVAYRLVLADKISIQPTAVGHLGFAYGREDIFDSILGFGYNLKLKVGYNFY